MKDPESLVFAHQPFTVVTSPIEHDLCGPLEYKPYFLDSQAPLVNDGSMPLTYNPDTLTFTVNTEDESYIGRTEDYGVTACFENYPPGPTYPEVSTDKNGSEIEFNNPCESPFSFAATDQTSPDPNYFDGEDIVFNLNPFTISPKCEITYTCESVSPSQPAGAAAAIECSSFNYDFVLDGTVDDGKLTFSATPQDYADGTYVPGTYTVTIKGCAKKAVPEQCADKTFDIVLLDPCDPPTDIEAPDYIDIAYTLETVGVSQPFGSFVAYRGEGSSRVECPVVISATDYTTLPDGRTAISENANDWGVFWTGDNYPVGKTETVKVTV